MVTGVLLALCAAACFGLSNAIGRIAISRSSVYTTALWSLVPSTVVLPVVVLGFVLNGTIGPADVASLPFFVAAGFCGDFVARLSLIGAVERLGASRAVAFRILAPLVSLAVGLLLLGEHLTWRASVGILFMLVGISVVQYDGLRRDHRLPVGKTSAPAAVASETEADGHAHPLLSQPTFWNHSSATSMARSRHRLWVRKGLVFGLAAGLSFGLADIFRKAGINAGGHPVLGALTTAATGMTLYLAVGLRRGISQHLRPPRDAYLPLIGAGSSILCAVVLFLTALGRIPVALGSTISGTQVFFAMLFGHLINRSAEQVSLRLLTGGLVTFMGFSLAVM